MRLFLLFIVAVVGATGKFICLPSATCSLKLEVLQLITIFTTFNCAASSSGEYSRIGAQVDSSIRRPVNFCHGCRSIVSFISRFNDSSKLEDNKELFSNFCELYYPASTDYQQGPCPVFVGGLFYAINQVDPVYHCDQIGACNTSEEPNPVVPFSAALQTGDGPVCKVCEQLVEQLKQQLKDPNFIKQVQERVDAFCSYLKAVNQEEVCKQMLRQYLDEAIEFIEAVEPVKYCQSLQLCSKKRLPESRTKLPTLADFSNFGIETSVELGGKVVKDVSNSPTCLLCREVIQELLYILDGNSTVEAIRHALEAICNSVYSSDSQKKECDKLVTTYSREIIEMISHMSDPKLICEALSLCLSRNGPRSKVPKQEPQSVAALDIPETTMSEFISMLDPTIKKGSMRSCVECKLFVNYLKTTLDGHQSQEELKEWLIKNLCDSLGDESMKSSCKNLVEKNAAEFFDAIAANLNPQATCQELGACKQRRYPLVFDFALMSSPDSFVLQPRPSFVPAKEQTVAGSKIEGPATPFCEGCVDVVRKIDEYLSAHSIEDDVNQLITEVCQKIPLDTLEKGCTRLVEYYGKEIMEHISVMDNPLHLCTKITLC